MRKAIAVLLLALLAISTLVTTAQAAYVPDEVIAKFLPNIGFRTKAFVGNSLGLTAVRSVFNADYTVYAVPQGMTPEQTIARLRTSPYVLYAERNPIAHVTAIPDDPIFRHQWSLQTPSSDSFGANVPDAWSISIGSTVQVAVLDTGCAFEAFGNYYANPDLDSLRVRPGWDFVNQDAHPNDDSNFGHGTHLCSLIGADTNNGFSGAGIAPGSTLMPVKCFDTNGIGTADRIASGLSYASWFGARVILIGGVTVERSQCLQDLIDLAAARGALVIAGAGNDGADLDAAPGVQHLYSQVMYVGATTRSGAPAPYSNRSQRLSVSAPGGAEDTEGPIASTYSPYDAQVPQYALRLDGSSVQPMHGTSVAAAHVAGVAALVIGALPGIPAAEVRAQIEVTAIPLGDPRSYGAGLIDATAAVGATTTPDPGDGGGDGGDGGDGGGPVVVVDAAVTGVTAPGEPVVMGNSAPVEVSVRNNGSTTQTITVTLQDEANGLTIGSQDVGLTPGQTGSVAFTWTALAPVSTHTLRATATVSGDGNAANNSGTAAVVVRAAQLQLRISPSKTSYRGGEWIFFTFNATDGGLPAPGTQVKYTVLGPNGYPIARNATATTGPDGQVMITLTYYYSLGGRGTYLIEATASRNGASVTARQTFTVTSARG